MSVGGGHSDVVAGAHTVGMKKGGVSGGWMQLNASVSPPSICGENTGGGVEILERVHALLSG